MKILVTGAKGFIGQNLISVLRNQTDDEIYEFDQKSDLELLDKYCQEADFVFHLAGANRPQDNTEFMKVNYGFTLLLLNTLKLHANSCPILYSSSIHALADTPYGISKKAGEELMFAYGEDTKAKVLVYRFPNVFGKWCRPNYNSVVATFCHNIAHDLPIKINDPTVDLKLVYIDDVVKELISALNDNENRKGVYCEVDLCYTVNLQEMTDLIYSFKESRKNKLIPDLNDGFSKKLYSTYLSYLPSDQFSYQLKKNIDDRGSFTEFVKTPDRGQVSVNISKPGIIKGNHWHHSKNEKFLVVAGDGVIRFRKINEQEVIEYQVSGNDLVVVDIPPGYTHNIENTGKTDMITIMWANELFDPEHPDIYYMEV